MTFEQLEQSFVAWAEAEPGVRAATIIGSRARTDHPADEWADLDILLFVDDTERFVADSAWPEQIGTVWLTFVERTPDGQGWERRVLFAGGVDVDFALNPAEGLRQMLAHGIPPIIAGVMRRGYRVLVDKDGLLAAITAMPLPEEPPFLPPSEHDFLNLVHDFWYHTVWTAKHLRRGELWWAKGGCDIHLKMLLQTMLEWHARATRGPAVDTWMRGRFLEEWADPRAVAELAGVFGHYDRDDIVRALWATMDLFRWLAVETAQGWGYAYPSAGDRDATELVRTLLG